MFPKEKPFKRVPSFLLLLCAVSATARAEVGTWEKQGSIGLDNRSCSQTWTCSAPPHIDYGSETQIVASLPKATKGSCGGGGAGESCGACAAEPPRDPCMWFLEPKARR